MKKKNNLLIITIAICLNISAAYAYKYEGENSTGNNKGNKNLSEGCVQGSSSTFLDLNNVRALIHTGGDMWWDLQGNASYEVPKGSGKMALFAGGIWIGGVDLNGQLRSCSVRYRSAGVDYWPGPLVTGGSNQGGVTSDVCDMFDKHWAVTRVEVEKFRTWFRAKAEGNTDLLESEDYLGYAPPKVIEEWPAHGDLLAGAGYDHYLAPFYDYNGDEEYDSNDGDYPFYDLDGELPCGTSRELRKPRLYGDQTLWWVYNDRGNVHMESNGTAIGMEIRAQTFSFATSDELNDMTFGNYALINRSSYTLTETYFGVWTDADMGSAWDDFVGCDVNRGLGYLYNGDETDGTGSGQTYGEQPPAIGVDFFEGPYQDADGIDNLSNWTPGIFPKTLDCSRTDINEGSINGLNFEDGIIDNERWGMKRFIFFNNGGGAYGDPDTDVKYYNYLRGYWADGSPMTFGGPGYGGSVPTDFMFPGKPTTDVCAWGTEGDQQGDWSEESEGNTPYDRRFVHSAGPFTLEPGATNDITTGMVWARASGGGAWASVLEVQRADDKAQKLFENCFQVVDGPDAPEVEIIELDRKLIIQLYNKKGSNNFENIPEDYYEKDPFIVCPVDEPTCDIYYRFEGYQVFQLKDKDASIADIDDPEKAKLVYQCDLENYDESGSAIGKLINYEYRTDVGAIVPTVKVEGKNEGIGHTFVVTEDLFASGDKKLVNHKKYYFIALAYGYNNYKPYIQTDGNSLDGQKEPYKPGRKGFSGSIKSYEGIPHIPAPGNGGTILNATYGDTPEIALLEGVGNGDNEIELSSETVDRIMAGEPWKVDSIGYEKGFGPINIKVVDPLNVPDSSFYLAFDSVLTVMSTRKSKIVRAKWKMWVADEYTTDTIYSDAWVSNFTGKRKTVLNEQLITEYGISISIGQVDFPLDGTDDNTHENDGFIDATFEFADESKQWLYFVPDYDGCGVYDWIKSGKLEEQGCKACNDYTTPVNDSKENYEDILFRSWAPYLLANKDNFRLEAIDEATNEVVSICTRKFGLAYYYGHTQIDERVFQIQSVDLVITSDQSKWTRSPVIELCEYDTTGGFNASGLSEGNTLKFSLRDHLSVGKDGNPDGELDADGDPRIGMGWFPGYAINVETGERLNIMFGEDSKFPQDNGRDLIWNPSSRWTTDMFIEGQFGDVYAGDVVWGGKHVIYIMGHSDLDPSEKFYQPNYDKGETCYKNLKQASATNVEDNFRRYVFANAMWVGVPVLNPDRSLLETDVKIRFRVASPYQVGRFDFAKANPRNNNNPLFRFDLSNLAPTTNDLTTAEDALDLIRAVPNPYKGYSEYELATLERVVKFTNLPQTCTISIYTVGGTLVRRYEKDNELSYLDWDLKNSYGIDIASGVYIIHVNAPGIGEKVVKWFGSLRPIDLSTF